MLLQSLCLSLSFSSHAPLSLNLFVATSFATSFALSLSLFCFWLHRDILHSLPFSLSYFILSLLLSPVTFTYSASLTSLSLLYSPSSSSSHLNKEYSILVCLTQPSQQASHSCLEHRARGHQLYIGRHSTRPFHCTSLLCNVWPKSVVELSRLRLLLFLVVLVLQFCLSFKLYIHFNFYQIFLPAVLQNGQSLVQTCYV